MYQIVQDFNHDIFAETDGPFVSIYQNTHPSPSDIEQDQIAFKNHLREAVKALENSYDEEVINDIIDPLNMLKDDRQFWKDNQKAIAVLASPNDYVVFRLNGEVNEKVVVANSFHVKPLIRHYQNRGMYDVLALDKERFSLYTCTLDECIKVSIEDDVPVTKEEVLGTLDKEGYLSHASYNGAANNAMYHGHADSKQVEEKDLERYFKYVDKFVNDTYSKQTDRRLVLWALSEHQGLFRKISQNKQLLDEGIHHSDKMLDENKILEETKSIILPIFKKEIKEFKNKYEVAAAKDMATDDLDIIGKKVIEGNIELAMVSMDKTVPGSLDTESGNITKEALDNPTYDDVLDDISEAVYHQGGKVIVLKEENMPTDKGIAVIYRY